MRSSAAIFIPISFLVTVAACSSTTIINHVAADSDAGTDDSDAGGAVVVDAGSKDSGAKKDAGVITAKNPQPTPPVAYNGGSILLNPSLVSVTFDNDTLRTQIESFDDSIGTTAYWDSVRAGFCDKNNKCIGPATGAAVKGHVHLSAATLLSSYTDSAGGGASTIQSMIATNIQNGMFPTPTADTLYMIYFPSSATISLDGTPSCMGFGAYHNSMKYNGTEFAYAIMPRCTSDFTYLTTAASHELAEAATDPYIGTDPNNPYTGYGSLQDAWDVPAGGEVGDRCFDLFGQGTDLFVQGSYTVQRIFNNAAASAGHDPCVPAPSPATTPYFNMAPFAKDGDIINLAVGASTKITVQATSDAPISGELAFDVQEITQQSGKGSNVLTLSGGGGVSIGQSATVNVTMKSTPSQGFALFVVRSSRIDTKGNPTGAIHYWPFLVQTP